MDTEGEPGFEITEPGIYDIDDEIYHADPVPGGSLSSTGARAILPPGCPARFRYDQQHTTYKREWDIGSAAHAEILGTGPELAILGYPDYRSRAAQESRNAARAAGQVPLLAHEYESVLAMVMQVRRHPVAGSLFTEGTGWPERSLFWTDPTSGVWCRARLDWIKPAPAEGGRLIVADIKTATGVDTDAVERAIGRYSYHQQAAFYLEGIRQLGLDGDPAFVFVFIEKTPPHLVHVVQLAAADLMLGEAKNRCAIELYAKCRANDHWPGYPTDITTVSLPIWQARNEEEEYLHHE